MNLKYGYQRIILLSRPVYDGFMTRELHRWDLTPAEAVKIQKELRQQIVLQWDGRKVTLIGGVDISIKPEVARAAIVVIRFPELTPVEAVTADVPLVFP